jgi:zinc protease
MLDRGTGSSSLAEIAETLDTTGASLSMAAGYHSTTIVLRALREDAEVLLRLVADLLIDPVFPDEELDKVRAQVKTRLAEMDDDTQSVSVKTFRRLVYGDEHPYGRRVAGTPDSVEAVTRDDLVTHHGAAFGPDGAAAVLVGDFSPKEGLAILGRGLASWTGSGRVEAAPPPPVAPIDGPRTEKVVLPDKMQSDVALGFPGIARSDPDYLAVELMNCVLGLLGLGGRLGARIRDREGMAYYVYSTFEAGLGAGPFMVRAGVASGDVDRCVRGILEEISRMRDAGPSQEEFDRARRYLVRSQPRRMETNEGVAALLLHAERHRLGLDYPERYPELVQDVTLRDAHRAAVEHLSAEGYALAVAGPPGPHTDHREDSK